MRISCIGAGNMAEAILGGWIRQELVRPDEVCVSDISPERRALFEERFGVRTDADNLQAVRDAQCILLAVKPQVLEDVLTPLKAAIPDDTLVVSIVAGKTSVRLASYLPETARIVRVMPNTPALVGQGMSGICAGPGAGAEDLEQVRTWFASIGKVAVVDEEQMDVLTALSGSGPAYVFYLMEHLIRGGVAEGMDEETASLLVRQTVRGAAELALHSEDAPSRLREKVTSKGGTTAAALDEFARAGVGDAVARAVAAAAARSRVLSGEG